MDFELLEDGYPCDFCGSVVNFNDDDYAMCQNCQAEFRNMDYYVE